MRRGRLPWITASLVTVSAGASFLISGGGELLQYARDGAWWTALTGQLVHWSARMTIVDLGLVLVAGCWIETRSRITAAITMLGATLVCALILPWTDLDLYRGSSGVAVALTVSALIDLSRTSPNPTMRRVAGAALILTMAKIALEWFTGHPLATGPLPPGVRVTTEVHVVGAAIGLVASVARIASRSANWSQPNPGT